MVRGVTGPDGGRGGVREGEEGLGGGVEGGGARGIPGSGGGG